MKPDFIVDGKLYRLETHSRQGFRAVTNEVKGGVKLTISRGPVDLGVFMKSYESEYTTKSQGDWDFPFIFRSAFQNMIKEISVDSELIEFIKK